MRNKRRGFLNIFLSALVLAVLTTSLFSGLVYSSDIVKVAFIDTGISLKHIEGAQVAEGKNYVFPEFDTQDRDGHGTATAGMMLGSEKLGLIGSCPEAIAVPLVTHDRYPSGVAKIGDVLTVCQAIYDAIDVFGCKVINISMGISVENEELRQAIEYAEEMGVVVVSAVGNDYVLNPENKYYPANYKTVIGVGAADITAEGFKVAEFSNRNGVSVLAQGVDLKTVTNRNDAKPIVRKGTSFASAYVAGLCAKILLTNPNLTPAQVRSLLYANADSLTEENSDEVWRVVGLNVQNTEIVTRGLLVNLLYVYEGEENREYEGEENREVDTLADVLADGSLGVRDNGKGTHGDLVALLPVEDGERKQDALGSLLPVDNGIGKNEADTLHDILPGASLGARDSEVAAGALDGKKKKEVETFADVLPGSLNEKGINWAVANGLVYGTGKNLFEPEKPVTQEQLAVILHRYAQYKEMVVYVGEETNILSYKDFDQLSEYAISAMQWACGSGLIQHNDGYLTPKATFTHYQLTNILLNFSKTYN